MVKEQSRETDGKEREKKETGDVICQSSPTFSPSLLPMYTSFTCFPCNINEETKIDKIDKFAFLVIPTKINILHVLFIPGWRREEY